MHRSTRVVDTFHVPQHVVSAAGFIMSTITGVVSEFSTTYTSDTTPDFYLGTSTSNPEAYDTDFIFTNDHMIKSVVVTIGTILVLVSNGLCLFVLTKVGDTNNLYKTAAYWLAYLLQICVQDYLCHFISSIIAWNPYMVRFGGLIRFH